MSRFLVTGAAGFIGSQVSITLCRQGHWVTGIDNLCSTYDLRLKHWRLEQLRQVSRFSFHHQDIEHWPGLESLCQQNANSKNVAPVFDGIINLAAQAGVRQSVANPIQYINTNLIGTTNLLEICKIYSIPKFIQASTSSVYGATQTFPSSESTNTDTILSPYAASKKSAETMCHVYHHLSGLDVSILRFFTVYGPAGRPDMSLFRFIHAILEGNPITIYGDGRQTRDFTYVDDIVNGILAALKPVGYEIFNLGSSMPMELINAIHIIENTIGMNTDMQYVVAHPADIKTTHADITKAKALLNWQPLISFAEGITRFVDWYQMNRSWLSTLRYES